MSDWCHSRIDRHYQYKMLAVMALAQRHTFLCLTKRAQGLQTLIEDPATPKEVSAIIRANVLRGTVDGTRVPTWMVNGERMQGGSPIAIMEGLEKGWRWPLHNVWQGITAENQEQLDRRWAYVRETEAEVHFISFEPLLGPIIRLPRDFKGRHCWAICGGETGPYARPMHPDWARSLRDQCVENQVPFFFKSFGEWRLRKPFPACAYWDDDQGQRWWRVGKALNGRLLDGWDWSEYPGADKSATE
jgi:protein gp37